ncbi:glycosyltransferase family 4 protein [Colwellia sp. RE-S-Sl-9]
MKIIIIGALPESLINFRGELIKKLVNLNHEVITMAAYTDIETKNRIEKLGCRYISYPIARNGINPFSDLKTFMSLVKVFQKERPNKVIAYTIKPVIWGGLSANLFSSIQFNALITGLGFAFQSGGFKRNVVKFIAKTLYKGALVSAKSVIFQNNDNKQTFIQNRIIPHSKAYVVNGSGVNLNYFEHCELPKEPILTFLTIARLLGDKGLREYVSASEIVLKIYPNIRFQILGPADPSPDGIKIEEVYSWKNKGLIEYLGNTTDVRPFIRQCHVFVLASYHEGLPRTVLEAMAIGRPILTTDVPGCRDTVEEGSNGFLVEKGNAKHLADKMLWFIENPNELASMGEASLAFAQNKYDVNKVNHTICNILEIN